MVCSGSKRSSYLALRTKCRSMPQSSSERAFRFHSSTKYGVRSLRVQYSTLGARGSWLVLLLLLLLVIISLVPLDLVHNLHGYYQSSIKLLSHTTVSLLCSVMWGCIDSYVPGCVRQKFCRWILTSWFSCSFCDHGLWNLMHLFPIKLKIFGMDWQLQ